MTSVQDMILIVDDDDELIKKLRPELRQAGFAVATAGNAEDALAACDELKPSIVVLDVVLPEEFMRTGERADGLTVLRRLRARGDTPVMMISSTSLSSLKVLAFDLGADDYVTKPFDTREFIARIRAILRRKKGAKAEERSFNGGLLRIDGRTRTVVVHDAPVDLTQLEFDILLTMAQKPRRVFTRGELIEASWPTTYCGDERVVDTHIYTIRKKFEGANGDPKMVQTVRGVGYKLDAVRD